ncbi:hypothetical protein [Gorillibacterium sp. sgz500922]|uniref:hypothetical protein n=1 Tax=Gorillibacterium sp. sgz500922 TaxID=3446694 RepID=UPI003F6791DF
MKKLVLAAAVLLLVIAALTVPSKASYIDWTKGEIKKQSSNWLIRQGVDLLGAAVLNKTTECKSYLVASRCTTDFGEFGRIRAIGLFDRFIGVEGLKREH